MTIYIFNVNDKARIITTRRELGGVLRTRAVFLIQCTIRPQGFSEPVPLVRQKSSEIDAQCYSGSVSLSKNRLRFYFYILTFI